MVRKSWLFIIAYLLMPMFALAQQPQQAQQQIQLQPSSSLRRVMNLRVLELVERYERSLRTSKRYPFSQRTFFGLYTTPNSMVYSDFIDYKPGEKISATEYAERIASLQYPICSISNLTKGEYTLRDGKWYVTVMMDKEVSYFAINKSRMADPAQSIVYFSSSEYYKQPYKVLLNCCYDPESGKASIASIDGGISSPVPLIRDRFMVVQRSGPKDSRIKVYGTPGDSLHFNSSNQAFIARDALRPWSDNVEIKADTIAVTSTFDHVKLSYKKTPFRAKVRFMTTLGSAFNVKSDINIDKKKSSAYEVGVDIGYTFSLGKRTMMGIYTGLGISLSSLKLDVTTPISYSYRMTDSEGARYNRNYTINSISEGVKYNDIVIPLYVQFDHKVHKRIYVNWSLGAKFYVNGKVTVLPYTISGNVTAKYDGSNKVVEQQEDGAIGSISGEYDKFLQPGSYTRSAMDASFLAGVGMTYNIYKGKLFASVKFGYEIGLGTTYDATSGEYFKGSYNLFPMVYSHKLNANVATKSFMTCVSYRRQAGWAELGLIYKF